MVEPKPKADPPDEGGTSAWVNLSYEAGIESIKAQRDELTGMRTRAIAFSGIVVAASAFLVGQGLSNPDRNTWFYVLAIAGTVGFVLVAAGIVSVLLPSLPFRFTLDPSVLMSWVTESTGKRTEEMAFRRLAMHTLPKMMEENEKSLRVIRARYRVILLGAGLTLVIWVSVVWFFA